MIIRRQYRGHLTSLAIDHQTTMISIGDLTSPNLVPQFHYTEKMHRRPRITRAGEQFVSLPVLRAWIQDLVERDRAEQAKAMQQVCEWAERTAENVQLQRVSA